MPDAAGNFKGQGYSAARAAGWERAFGRAAESKYTPISLNLDGYRVGDVPEEAFLSPLRRAAESSRENQDRDESARKD